MMKTAVRLALAAGLALSASGSMATTWAEVTLKCPIGGKKFKTSSMASNSYFGQRPDGRPYSPMPVTPLFECPDNGFVLYKEKFSQDEIARLTPLVASAEYQAMRQTETQYYRAWWLMEQVGASRLGRISNLMVAGWESDSDAPRKARYQAAFVTAVGAFERDPASPVDWFWLNLRAANALRELGRFDESTARLDAIDQPNLLPTDEDQLTAAKRVIAGLRALNADRNTASEPANLIPARMAIVRCKQEGLSPAEQSVCSGDEVKSEIAEQAGLASEDRQAAARASQAAKAAAAAGAAAAEAAMEAAAAADKAVRKSKAGKTPESKKQ